MLTVKSSAITVLALVGASVGAYSLWEKTDNNSVVADLQEEQEPSRHRALAAVQEEQHDADRKLFVGACADFGLCCQEPIRRRLGEADFLEAMNAERDLQLSKCETAYAVPKEDDEDYNCFINLGISNSWGWRIDLDASAAFPQTFPVYGAAGQCKLSNGAEVGTLSIDYDAGSKKCTGTFYANGAHGINQFHFYCGQANYPTKRGQDTVANGRFPCKKEKLGLAAKESCFVDDVLADGAGEIHAIAHFVACGTGGTDYCADQASYSCETPKQYCESYAAGYQLCGDQCCDSNFAPQFPVIEHCIANANGQFCFSDCDNDGAGFGDPHFRTWHHMNEFEYHGECDLVFLKAPKLDMDIHIRTTIRYDYSFISQVAVRIGDEIFEVASWGEYQLDGMASVDLPAFIGGYPITQTQEAQKQNLKVKFAIHLDDNHDIRITSYKDYVAVRIDSGSMDMYQGSAGILGDFETGSMFMRDGTINEEPSVYAPEWQVRPEVDGVLFAGERAPVFPQKCVMPAVNAVSARARKLGEASVTLEQAKAACAHQSASDQASCIEDVLKTQDLDMADAN